MPIGPLRAGASFTPPGADAVPNQATPSRPPLVTPASLAAVITRPGMLAIVWLCAIVTILNIGRQLPQLATRWDFSIYYMSATLLHEGQDPYTTDFGPVAARMGLQAGDIRHATDPPTFLLLMEPLALMPERLAYYTWVGFNGVLLALALMLLLGRSTGLGSKSALALTALALLYPPVEWHFLAAQSKIPILLLLVVMIRLMERGWERGAGLCLAFAGLLRMFPLLLLGYLVLQRRWRTLIWTLIGVAGGGLATIWLLGLHDSLSFRFGVRLLTEQYYAGVPANIALGATVSRLFWFIAGKDPGAGIDLVRRIAVVASEAALLGATIYATLKVQQRDPGWRALGSWIVISVLLSPLAWSHYMVLFFIPFAQLATNARNASQRAQWAAILSYVVMFLTSVPLRPVAEIIYSHQGREHTRSFMSLMVEGWFVSAMLAYLATYWFAVNSSPAASRAAQSQPPLGLGQIAAEKN